MALDATVRRFLGARIRDPHLIDDLAQETLIRVAQSDRELSDDEQRAYAVVTARNLLASHYRAQSVQRRHAHRLAEVSNETTDAAQPLIADEESTALATALTRLDPSERELLVRHEVRGTDLATLADDSTSSRGAIAMRLARARANLRLEFLLVFRRLSLPTENCRPVLLALAAGERRRQRQLDATGHVEDCPTCAALLKPMIERDRRVAAWLIVPLGDLCGRLRKHFCSWWVRAATAALVLGAIGGLVVLRHQTSGRAESDSTPASSRPVPTVAVNATKSPATPATRAGAASATVLATPPAVTAPAVAAPAPPVPGPAPAGTAPAATGGAAPPPTDQSPCPAPLPLTELDPARFVGCPFATTVVIVDSVNGSALTAAAGQWSVALDLPAASLPIPMLPGTRLSIAGTLDAAPSTTSLQITVDTVSVAG